MPNRFLGIFIALGVLGGLVWYGFSNPPTAPETSLPLASPFKEAAPYYEILANYPTTTPLRAALGEVKDREAVTLMRAFVSRAVSEFKKNGDFENLTQEDIEMMGFNEGRKWKLQTAYLIGSSARTLSYIFTVYEDTGGAHGNIAFRTFVFDAETGDALSLADVFAPGAPYLERLSLLARAKLPGVIGEFADTDSIAAGTEPTEENFSNFFFDNKNLVFVFPPYQVGPYALGSVTLPIPTSELQDILKSGYP